MVITHYFKNKKKEFILVGVAIFGLASAWFPDAITFIVVIITSSSLSDEFYLSITIYVTVLTTAFTPISIMSWLTVITYFLEISHRKSILLIFGILIRSYVNLQLWDEAINLIEEWIKGDFFEVEKLIEYQKYFKGSGKWEAYLERKVEEVPNSEKNNFIICLSSYLVNNKRISEARETLNRVVFPENPKNFSGPIRLCGYACYSGPSQSYQTGSRLIGLNRVFEPDSPCLVEWREDLSPGEARP